MKTVDSRIITAKVDFWTGRVWLYPLSTRPHARILASELSWIGIETPTPPVGGAQFRLTVKLAPRGRFRVVMPVAGFPFIVRLGWERECSFCYLPKSWVGKRVSVKVSKAWIPGDLVVSWVRS